MLGDRELDVMGVLWERGDGTVAEVREQLADPLAYTTVLTILRNLESKGFVRHSEEGRAHRYHPVLQRSEVGDSMLQHLIGTVFEGSAHKLLTHLVDAENITPEDLSRLHALVSRRLEEEGSR